MKKNIQGFVLPTVLLLSLVVLGIVMALLAVTSSSFKGQPVDHYQKLADEAAEAGTAYASACLTLSGHFETWGPAVSKPNLAPSTDCYGNAATSYTGNGYVYSDSSVRSYFSVGRLDYLADDGSQISSIGYAQVLRPNGSVAKTYTSIQKKLLVWPRDLVGQMSVAGTNRTCAIVSYEVNCWGLNAYGQLGNNKYIGSGNIDASSSIDSLTPVRVYRTPGVMAGKKIVKIFAAQYHSCALSQDGKMYCWGRNEYGQLGDGTTSDARVPVEVGGPLTGKVITDIGGTQDTSCAVAENKFYCWGRNDEGQAGIGSTSWANQTILTPRLVNAAGGATGLPSTYTATKLAASGTRSATMCGIANANAYCWGRNNVGQIGDGSTTQRNSPTVVGGLLAGKTVTAISQDGRPNTNQAYVHVCAVASGTLYCWGENYSGQLGNNSNTDSTVPVAVYATGSSPLRNKTVQDVEVGLQHSCARASGGVYCWGEGGSGQLGNGSNSDSRVPVAVTTSATTITSSNVISIGAGAHRGCAINSLGLTFCWGLNNNGQIGDGTRVSRNMPTESLYLRPVQNQYIF